MAESAKVGAEDMVGPKIAGVRMTYEQVVELWRLFNNWDQDLLNNAWVGKDNIGPPDASRLPDWIQQPSPLTFFAKHSAGTFTSTRGSDYH